MQNDKSSQSNFPSPSHNTPSPADLQGLFVAAVSAHQASRYDEAEQLYGRVRALRPDNVNLLCNLGLLYRDMGRPSQALARLQEAHALAPDNFAVNLNIGALFEEQGELDQAVIAYRAAQELAPHDPRVMNNLGKALYQQGDRPGALDYLNRAVALAPDYAMAHNNLGVLLNSLGRLEEAIACFRKALAHDEQNCDILYNLAGALSLVGGNDEARTCYEKLLDIEPRHAAARHMLAALSGMATAKAPAAYVVDTFDRYAGHFDNQLTEQLGYRVPELLGRAVAQTMGDAPFRHCLDLGCGTGLSGLAFKDLAVQMSGVDLSPRMLAQARAKAIYDTLHQEDVVTFLERGESTFDLFVATDVFIYIGDLRPLFAALRGRAAAKACFAFSIETIDEDREGAADHLLRSSGRYAHSVAYVERLAEQGGFGVVDRKPCTIRKEQGSWLTGHLFVLRAW